MGALGCYSLSSCSALALDKGSRRVLVTGAGGQTGQHIFRKLLTKPGWAPIGTVRSEGSRQALLEGTAEIGASSPDGAHTIPSESVAICDISNDDTWGLGKLLKDCSALFIVTSAKPAPTGEIDEETKRPKFGFPNGQPEVVDFEGQRKLIDAAKANNKNMHVVLCSSMGGTNPNNPLNDLGKETNKDGDCSGGDILKWNQVYLTQLFIQEGYSTNRETSANYVLEWMMPLPGQATIPCLVKMSLMS